MTQVQLPLVAFWIKTIAEIVNIAVFGRKSSKDREGLTYGEGFYCAVFSCGLSGIVAALLLFHYAVQRNETWKDSLRYVACDRSVSSVLPADDDGPGS